MYPLAITADYTGTSRQPAAFRRRIRLMLDVGIGYSIDDWLLLGYRQPPPHFADSGINEVVRNQHSHGDQLAACVVHGGKRQAGILDQAEA
jgi:hypothetical protein